LKTLYFESLQDANSYIAKQLNLTSDRIGEQLGENAEENNKMLQQQEIMEKLLHNLGDSHQAKFLNSYMNQVLSLMHFIKASRTGNWALHLASCDMVVKYFFAHDLYKYAKYTSYYLADMSELQRTDPETWQHLESGNMSVFKSDIPFTGLGVDHALEQEIETLKMARGITGITQKESALSRYLLASPELSRIEKDFSSETSETISRETHYQLQAPIIERVAKDVFKLCKGIRSHYARPFDAEGDEICSLIKSYLMSLKLI
jgi:hypothetical protein